MNQRARSSFVQRKHRLQSCSVFVDKSKNGLAKDDVSELLNPTSKAA